MKRIIGILLAVLLCFGTACAAGEFDWLKEWDDCEFEASTPDAFRVKKDGKWGFVDGEGKVLIEPKYDMIDSSFGFADVFEFTKVDGKYGFVNNQGREIAPPEYDNASSRIANGLGWLKKDGMYALVNENGLISDFIYESVYPHWSISAAMKDGKWGMVNTEGECPAGFIFDEIDQYDLSGRIGDKYAALNKQGELLLPAEYDKITRPYDYDSDLIFFMKDGVEGWLNTEDGSYVETQYKGLEDEDDGYVRYEWNGKTGFLDMEGKLVAEFDIEGVYSFNGEYVEVITDYFEAGVINRDGEWILEKKYIIDGKIDRHNTVRVREKDSEYVCLQIVDDEPVPISTLYKSSEEYALHQELKDAGLAWEVDVYAANYPNIYARWSAYEEGWEYAFTPVAKDALVFVENADNPVENLSSGDIRWIYGGFIDDWSDLGADPGEIIAYQEDEYSVERKLFDSFMQGAAVMEPEWDYGPDGERFPRVYRNLPGAIGCCLYSHIPWLPEDIKVISVDGIMPTAESIRSGEYPWTVNVVSVETAEKRETGAVDVEKYGFVPLQ